MSLSLFFRRFLTLLVLWVSLSLAGTCLEPSVAVAREKTVTTTKAKKTTQTKKKATKKKSSKKSRAGAALPHSGASNIVIEARTGRILQAVNEDALRYPASLTKMMTLYIAFQAIEAGRFRLEQTVPVSAHAAAQSPSKLGLKRGTSIRVQDAVMGLVTESANDAAVVLGEAMGGSEEAFGKMMTRQARALGMTKTVFHNPSGLPDPRQVTTAHDMAILGHALIMHYPQFYEWFSRESFTYKGRTFRNHNHLMREYQGMDGIKTGYIRASGFNLVSSAVRGDTRLIGVVLGGKARLVRDAKMAEILDDGFAVAQSQRVRVAQGTLQARRGDVTDAGYIALPSKVAAVFPSRGAPSVEVASYALPISPSHLPLPQHKPVWGEEAEAEAEGAQGDDGDETVVIDGSNPTNWGIQVGAFTDETVARMALASMAKNMPSLVGQADHILQKVTMTDGNIVYRARFMGMIQPTARSICSYMVRNRQSCLVVSPDRVAE